MQCTSPKASCQKGITRSHLRLAGLELAPSRGAGTCQACWVNGTSGSRTHLSRTSAFWKHAQTTQALSFQSQLFHALNPNSEILRNVSKVARANMKQQKAPAAAKHSTKSISERCGRAVPTLRLRRNAKDRSHLARTRRRSQGTFPEPGENWGAGDNPAPRKGSEEGVGERFLGRDCP